MSVVLPDLYVSRKLVDYRRLSAINADEAEEFIPRLLLAFEASQDAACDGASRCLLNSSHNHAEMSRFHYDGDTLWFENFHDGIGDFLGQALLDLQTAGKQFGDAGELRDADDSVRGDVSNVHLSSEGHKMMLAHTVGGNVSICGTLSTVINRPTTDLNTSMSLTMTISLWPS